MNKRLEKKLASYRAKAEAFKADLQEYINTTGDNELPDIDTTCIGYSPLDFEITDLPNGGFKVKTDGIEIEVYITKYEDEDEDDGEEYITGWDCGAFCYDDTLKETIKYERRRLNKAWKVWRSENPDAELEKDDEDYD